MFNFLKNVSPTELIIIAVILLLLFGATVMKKLARTSGQTFKEVKKIKNEFNQAVSDDTNNSNNG